MVWLLGMLALAGQGERGDLDLKVTIHSETAGHILAVLFTVWTINQSNFYSANISGRARLSGPREIEEDRAD